jgi:cyanophycinase
MARKGKLIAVGGGEGGEGVILETIAAKAIDGGRLVVIIIATEEPERSAAAYRRIFRKLGVEDVSALIIEKREDALDKQRIDKLKEASVVFIPGGDQLKMTGLLGDSKMFQTMQELYKNGATIAGSSAGATILASTMIISGDGDDSDSISGLGMASGFGFIKDMVIDSHFAERGRINRLLGAVTQNPKNLGIGLDEDAAVVIGADNCFSVIGSGAVYVVDGSGITYSSLSEQRPEGIVTIHDVKLHVLQSGDKYDLKQRRPIITHATVAK